MLTSTRRGIIYPNTNRSDSADVPRDIAALVAALEVDVVYGQGTLAARPAAGLQGRLYCASDQVPKTFYWDDGAAWNAIGGSIADGSITAVKLATDVAVIPIGAVVDWPWGSGTIPTWSGLPYGQAISRATYVRMAQLDDDAVQPHGTSATNVVLPDYRGRAGIGKDNMGGATAGRITAAIAGVIGTLLGGVCGSEGVTLITAQLPVHNHAHSLVLPNHVHEENTNTVVNAGGGAGSSAGGVWNSIGNVGGSWPTNNPSSLPAIGGSISNAGSGSVHQNTQPSIVVNKIMRLL